MVWPMRGSGCGGPCCGSMKSPRRIILSSTGSKVAASRSSVSPSRRMHPLVVCAVVGLLASRPAWADDLPDIKSRSAVVLDAETGAEIFGKDADEIRPIASTTKIFVAMAVRKQLDLGGWTEINKVDAHHAVGGARTRLDIGQTFSN